MKKNIKINFFFLAIAIFFTVTSQAQQQKPSERSFAAEINKVKEKQAARNKMIAKMQQTMNATPAIVTQPALNEPVANSTGKATSKSTVVANQQTNSPVNQTSINKPSSGPMKKPQFPVKH
jgi:hypothetical protein